MARAKATFQRARIAMLLNGAATQCDESVNPPLNQSFSEKECHLNAEIQNFVKNMLKRTGLNPQQLIYLLGILELPLGQHVFRPLKLIRYHSSITNMDHDKKPNHRNYSEMNMGNLDRRETKNQVLPKEKVQEIVKRKIKAALFDKTLSNNVALMTFLIMEIAQDGTCPDPIDIRVEKIIKKWHDLSAEE